jgi:dolichol-phosphate mannosyltransferase
LQTFILTVRVSKRNMNISVVFPAHNEEDNIKPLYSSLVRVLENSDLITDYEIIFVDDGSTDQTYSNLVSIKDRKVHTIRLKHNMGQSAALKEGFKKAKNEIIVTLDADLQNDPSDIEGMVRKLLGNYECVCGWRYERADPFVKVVSSKIANRVRHIVLKDGFHDMSCGMRVFKKECLCDVELFDGAHRFLPFLIQLRGHRVTEHKIRHHPRKFGESKYNIQNRIFKTLCDLIYVKKMQRRAKRFT